MAGNLAQTIQGEAATPEGQFAVAATIYNRMRAGNFPGGTDPYAIVNAPQQYVGYAATPSATAQALADAIQNGTLEHYGTVGNATYFQSGYTAARNGLTAGANIAGNWFSDLFGAPSKDFVAPSLGTSQIAAAPGAATSGGATPPIAQTSAGGATGGGALSAVAGSAVGAPVALGLQPTLVKSIQDWITSIAQGVWQSVWATAGNAFLALQNWFVRGFLILVGVVVLGVGLMHLSEGD
jgi:hypothetical protein